MGRAQRCIGSLNEGLPSDVTDVMVARRLDVSGLRVVQNALNLLEKESVGLVSPISSGEILLPMFGGSLLKRAVLGEKAKRHNVRTLSAERMAEIEGQLLEMRDFASLTLKIDSPGDPFHVNDQDELVVGLRENRQLERDRRKILSAMRQIVGSPSRSSEGSFTYLKPPHVTIAVANSYPIDDPEERERFMTGPSSFIKEILIDRQDLTSDPDEVVQLFPTRLTFGLPEIVPRAITPSHLSVLNIAESPFAEMVFDENNKAQSSLSDDDYFEYSEQAV